MHSLSVFVCHARTCQVLLRPTPCGDEWELWPTDAACLPADASVSGTGARCHSQFACRFVLLGVELKLPRRVAGRRDDATADARSIGWLALAAAAYFTADVPSDDRSKVCAHRPEHHHLPFPVVACCMLRGLQANHRFYRRATLVRCRLRKRLFLLLEWRMCVLRDDDQNQHSHEVESCGVSYWREQQHDAVTHNRTKLVGCSNVNRMDSGYRYRYSCTAYHGGGWLLTRSRCTPQPWRLAGTRY